MRGVKQGTDKRIRKIDKSRAEIVLRDLQYFEEGRDQKLCLEVSQVVKRIFDATGVSEVTLGKIKTTADVENWLYNPGQKVSVERQNEEPR